MKNLLHDALRSARADYTDIRLERSWRTAIGFRGSRLEGATTALEEGGVVRCLNRGRGWGVAGFQGLAGLRAAVARAHELSLAVAVETPVRLADIPIQDADHTADLDGDVRGIALAEKRRFLDQLNQEMLATDRRIAESWAGYRDAVIERWVATSEGVQLHDLRPSVRVAAGVMAREENFVERAFESWAVPGGWHSVLAADYPFRAAARRAVALLAAPRVRAGSYPVVLDPRAAGALVHQAIGHLCEAGRSTREADASLQVGQRVASDLLTVGDDGSASGLAGARPFDDEGAPTQNTLLVQHGAVVGRLHTRETAARAGVPATGNARTTGVAAAPSARLTNVYVSNGKGTLEELIRGIPFGIYLADAIAGHAALGRFALTTAWGQVIRDGHLAELVKPVTLAGEVRETLQRVDAVAGDFHWSQLASACSRDGFAHLPVAEGAPHLRFDRLAIGGDPA
jgi:TldD protein